MNKVKEKPRKNVIAQFNPTPTDKLDWVDGDMNESEFQIATERLGLSPYEVGEWLGMSLRHGVRFIEGDVKIPPPVAKLVTLMLRLGLKPEQV